jgi:hypothetical protein
MKVAVLPPPPSSPDDGPGALDLPRPGRPPTAVAVGLEPRAMFDFPLRAWAAFVTLFGLGTIVTLLVQR